MDPPPTPRKKKFIWPKCATAPPIINILLFALQPPPPSLELPDGCNGCRWGWGWG